MQQNATRKPKKKHILVTNNQIKEALFKSGGVLVDTAKLLNVDRSVLYRRFKENPDLRNVIEEAKELNVDLAESALMKLIEKGNVKAIIYYLETQGKNRGYGRRLNINSKSEVTHSDKPGNVELDEQQSREFLDLILRYKLLKEDEEKEDGGAEDGEANG